MPPQPLLSIRHDATVESEPESTRRYPALMLKIADVVTIWSSLDNVMGVILARMLGAKARPAVAMFTALTSSQAQRAVLQAAAKTALSPEWLELFGALFALVKRVTKKRNAIAHQVWAVSPQVPDTLVLLPPATVLELHTNNAEVMAMIAEGKAQPGTEQAKLNLSAALVYRAADFDEIIDEMATVRAHAIVFALMLVLNERPDGQLFRQLSAAPQIQKELERARKSAQRNQ